MPNMRSSLFERDPEPELVEAPAAVPVAPTGPPAPGITDAEAKRKNRALAPFVMMLTADSMTAEKLLALDPDDLARRYPPLQPDDLAQMIRVRLKRFR